MNCYAVFTSTITREIGKSCFDGKKCNLRAKLLFCFSDLLLFPFSLPRLLSFLEPPIRYFAIRILIFFKSNFGFLRVTKALNNYQSITALVERTAVPV